MDKIELFAVLNERLRLPPDTEIIAFIHSRERIPMIMASTLLLMSHVNEPFSKDELTKYCLIYIHWRMEYLIRENSEPIEKVTRWIDDMITSMKREVGTHGFNNREFVN